MSYIGNIIYFLVIICLWVFSVSIIYYLNDLILVSRYKIILLWRGFGYGIWRYFITVIISLLILSGWIFALSTIFNYYPQFVEEKGKLFENDVYQSKYNALDTEANRLRNVMENINDLSLKEIQGEFSNTLKFFTELEKQMIENKLIINEMEADIVSTKANQARADSILTIRVPQLVALESYTSDKFFEKYKNENRKSNIFWFIMGTFTTGLIAFIFKDRIPRNDVVYKKRDTEMDTSN